MNKHTETITKLGIMSAVSLAMLLIVRIPFPPAPFLVYDPADVPIYITAFAFGPVQGLLVTLVVCFIQAFMLGGDGVYGFVMHFIATGIVAVAIGRMYRKNRTRKTAAAALIAGVLIMTAVMCVMNIFVTSVYMGLPKSAVIAMLPTIIIPFNLLKGGINSVITFFIYKRISPVLHREFSRS